MDDQPERFVALLLAESVADYEAVGPHCDVVFDRAIPDCIAYAAAFGVDSGPAVEASHECRYSGPVFVAPPWEEIYTTDGMRRATYDMTVRFDDHIRGAYETMGYDLIELPKLSVAGRVAFVLGGLAGEGF